MLSKDEITVLSYILSYDEILEIEQKDKNYEEILDDLFKQHKNCYANQILAIMPVEKITKKIVHKAIEADGSNFEILDRRGIIKDDETRLDLIKKALNSNMLIYGYLDKVAFNDEYSEAECDFIDIFISKNATREQEELIYGIYQHDGMYGIYDAFGDTKLLGNTKFYAKSNNGGVGLWPTARKGENVVDYDNSGIEDDWFIGIAYGVGLPIEANKKLLECYLHNEYDDCKNFINYHLYDLIECLGGKEGLISFVKDNESLLGENAEEYLEQLSNDIDEAIRRREEYTVAEIAEGISPREGEIQEVLGETIQNKTNEKSETIEKPGEEQGDN